MKKGIAILLSMLSLILFSFSDAEEAKYEKEGFSITIPHKWKIKTEKMTEDGWTFVSCSKKGLFNSGITAIKWIEKCYDLDSLADIQIRGLQNRFENLGAFFSYDPSRTDTIAGKEAVVYAFHGSLLDTPHDGKIYAFRLCNHTVILVEQGATEDAQKNDPGFLEIRDSFACESKDRQ